jgi:hypothetical protein
MVPVTWDGCLESCALLFLKAIVIIIINLIILLHIELCITDRLILQNPVFTACGLIFFF